MFDRLIGKRGRRPEPPPAQPAPDPPPAAIRLLPPLPPEPPPPVAAGGTHRIYTGRHAGGELFGKCACGATLKNEAAIAAHRHEHNLPTNN